VNLYVWVNPYPVNYGSSLIISIASSLEEAKLVANDKLRARAYSYGEYERAFGPITLGAPKRVVSLPCAEWYEWSE
jgi:hypothetical protein